MNELTKQWNNLVTEHGPRSGAFLQSWGWGVFQRSLDKKLFRYVLSNNEWLPMENTENQESRIKNQETLEGVAQIIKMPLLMGKSYLYVPRGSITISNFQFPIFNSLLDKLKKLAKQENAIFVKVELLVEKNNLVSELIGDLNPSTSSSLAAVLRSGNKVSQLKIGKNLQPQDTLILNLEKSEEELLGTMHEKTRYNIRLAEKKGVQVRWATAETLKKDLDNFWRLAQETAKRDKFSYHPKSYYQKMIENFKIPYSIFDIRNSNDLHISIAVAEKDGQPLATNIIIFFGNTVTYLHGASNYARRELMAPYLLQWRTIQEAKKLGYKNYDFWGIMPQESRIKNPELRHPWDGITRFKMGFGGKVVSYAPTLDLIVNNFWYKLYHLGKLLLKS